MSFLFKSKKANQAPPGQPNAAAPPRQTSSSHGASVTSPTQSSGAGPGGTTPNPSGVPAGAPQPTREPPLSASGKQYSAGSNVRSRPSDNDMRLAAQQSSRPPGSAPQQHTQAPSQTGHVEKFYYPIDPSSPFPWSLRLTKYTPLPPDGSTELFPPLPRYGAAVNSTCDRDRQIYMFGGLVGTSPTNDLWVLDCSGLVTTVGLSGLSEAMKLDLAVPSQTDTGTVFTEVHIRQVVPKGKVPSPRVGHAALLAGNAFIVFGGDTPGHSSQDLDNTLYFFNTDKKQMSWTAPECVNRPEGRYGHTLTLIKNNIFLFGGQREDRFFNDLHAYDLNKIQSGSAWVKFDVTGAKPAPRTNHSTVAWNGKLYIFGGTDGSIWFNDVWCFDPATSHWTQMDCIGYIPLAREGHSATLVDDMMYVIGGRVKEGAALRDLSAFKISSGRWFSFQNMGIPPSARSGHSMTTIDNHVVTIGGHSDALEINELRYAYVLDTKKIAFESNPNSRTPQQTAQNFSRKNTADSGMVVDKVDQSKNARPGTGSRQNGSINKGSDQLNNSRLPRVASSNGMNGPAPRNAINGRTTPNGAVDDKQRSASAMGHMQADKQANGLSVTPVPPNHRANSMGKDTPQYQPYSPGATGQSSQTSLPPGGRESREGQRVARQGSRGNNDVPVAETAVAAAAGATAAGIYTATGRPTRSNTAPTASTPADSGIGSYGSSPVMNAGHTEDDKRAIDDLQSQLHRLKLANTWYASEVALASKAGYVPNPFPNGINGPTTSARFSPSLDQRASLSNPDTLLPQISEEDKPLVQVLLKTRGELNAFRARIESEAQRAAQKIAEIEKQRDKAVEEAVYYKAKLAGVGSSAPTPVGERGGSAASIVPMSISGTPIPEDGDRITSLDRRLAEAIIARNSLTAETEMLRQALESEKRACSVAQANARASQEQMAALNSYQQRASSEIEGLKAQLHEANQKVRDEIARANAAEGREKVSLIEASTAKKKLASYIGGAESDVRSMTEGETSRSSSRAASERDVKIGGVEAILSNLKTSMKAALVRADSAEKRLKEEREKTEETAKEMLVARSELEESRRRIERLTERLDEAEKLAEQHAEEAERHRAVVEGGLEKLVEQESSDRIESFEAKITALEKQLQESAELVAESHSDTRAAEDTVRQAQERIAGLETFQATTSLENLKVRDQLQTTTIENSRLNTQIETLTKRIDEVTEERDTGRVQLETLSALVEEHGLKETEVENERIAELEKQVLNANSARLELETEWTKREATLQSDFTTRLDKIEKDYENATKQIENLEHVINQMNSRSRRVETRAKQFKEINEDLRHRLEHAESRLLQYLSQDMEPTDVDHEDDHDDTLTTQVLNRLNHNAPVMPNGPSGGRTQSSLSYTSGADPADIPPPLRGHVRAQGSLGSFSSAEGNRRGAGPGAVSSHDKLRAHAGSPDEEIPPGYDHDLDQQIGGGEMKRAVNQPLSTGVH